MSFFDSTVREQEQVAAFGAAFDDAVRRLRNELAHGRQPTLPEPQRNELADLLGAMNSMLQAQRPDSTRATRVPSTLVIKLDKDRETAGRYIEALPRVVDHLHSPGTVEREDIEVLDYIARASTSVASSSSRGFRDDF